jgi:hypothetical protein
MSVIILKGFCDVDSDVLACMTVQPRLGPIGSGIGAHTEKDKRNDRASS